MIGQEGVLVVSLINTVDGTVAMEAGTMGSETTYFRREHAFKNGPFPESSDAQGGEPMNSMDAFTAGRE